VRAAAATPPAVTASLVVAHRAVAARRVPHLMPLMESAEMEDAQAAAEQVISSRGGSVLGKKTILKSDHFPGCQNRRLSPQMDGAPNYRQVRLLLPPCSLSPRSISSPLIYLASDDAQLLVLPLRGINYPIPTPPASPSLLQELFP
jgi:hypothetical protein